MLPGVMQHRLPFTGEFADFMEISNKYAHDIYDNHNKE
jgi:hypothetical protein